MDSGEESTSEQVVGRSYRRVIMIAVFGLIALGALMLMSSEHAEAYTVTGTETWVVDTYLSEDLIIAPGGVLNVQNANIYMQPTYDGEYLIVVQNGGTLNTVGAEITHDALFPFTYDFVIDQGSTASLSNTRISYAGSWNTVPAVVVISGDITMNGVSITDNQFAGLFYANDTRGFTATNCYFGSNLGNGVYILDVGAPDYYFTFDGGTVIENNVDYGIYVDSMSNKDFGLTLQDTTIKTHSYGVFVSQISDGSAYLNFQTANIVENAIDNVYVGTMSNADLKISSVNSHLDSSSLGFGVYVDIMSGALGSNLTVSMSSTFVTGNAGSGIYVNMVDNGWMDFDFVDSFTDANGGDGITIPTAAPGNVVLFDALRTSFSGNSASGVYFGGGNPGSMFITVDDCDFYSNGLYGMDVGRVVDGDLSLTVINSQFGGNSGFAGAIVSYGIYNGDAWILVGNNEFNNSYDCIYLGNTFDGVLGNGHMLSFTFSGNWHDSDLGTAGVFFDRDVHGFDETTITINDNHFHGREVKPFGVFFSTGIFGDFSYWQNLTMDVSGNEFFYLDECAFWSNSGFYGFRNVDISMNGNVLMDTDWDYNYGFILMDVHGNTNYDTSLNLVANSNIFMNLTEFAFYSTAFNFRHVNIDISNNVVFGNGATIIGFLIDGLMYGSTNEPSDLIFNANNNEFYDLLFGNGFHIATWWAPFFTDADMYFTNNHFNGSATGTFSNGIYIEGDVFYNWNIASSLIILMDNNDFIDLEAAGVYFDGSVYDFSDMNLIFANNLFENRYTISMYYGIFTYGMWHSNLNMANSLVLAFDGNEFYDLLYDGVYIDQPISGFRDVALNIDRNIIENRMAAYMDYGFYFSGGMVYDTNDYDNYLHISITENVIRDMTAVGVYFGSWTPVYGFRHVDIQIHDNLMENVMDVNNMDFGIEWYYEIFYSTSAYDSSFVIDITGNVIRDLSWDGIAFRNNGGWEFGMFTNVTVNIQDNVLSNQVSGGMDTGIYLRPFWSGRTDVDNLLDVTIVNNTFDSLTVAGIHFAAYIGLEFEGYRTVNFVISQNVFTNTIGNLMDSGVVMQGFIYWDSSFANSLYFEISDNTFNDLTAYGVHVGGPIFYYSQVDINTFGNYFSDVYNDFDAGVYFTDSIFYDFNNEGYLHYSLVGNQFYDLRTYGFHFGGDISDFRNMTIEIQNNVFMNTFSNDMDHGVYFGSVYYSDTVYDNYLLFDITNNRFENLSQYGINIYWIFGFRHVTIDIMSNHFSDIYNSFDCGVYFVSEIGYDTLRDGSFIANIASNTFIDLASGGVRFASDVQFFRSVWINVDNNDFVSYQGITMAEGVRFSGVYYWADDQDSIFLLDVTNNNYENLTDVGFEIGYIYFRHVTINVVNNHYSDVHNTFSYGFYANSDISYTTDYDSDLNINILDNTALDLDYMGVGFSSIYEFRNVAITIDNNDLICPISSWLDFGVYFDGVYYNNPSDNTNFQLMFTSNNFENLTQFGFYMSEMFNYRHVVVDVLNNYFSDIHNNFDFGWYVEGFVVDVPDTNTDIQITVTGNEFRDLYMWGGGLFIEDVENYHMTVIDVNYNDFICTQNSRMYEGILIGYITFTDSSFDNYAWINYTNNNFENFYEYGICMYEIWGFRHVFLDFLDNTFSDVFSQSYAGIFIEEDSIYYDTSYDSELHINIIRNTFQDIGYAGTYFDCNIYDFRSMWITIQDNDFINTISNWMDYGVRFQSIYYNTNSHDSYMFFDVNNNTFQNLANRGIYVSQLYNFRHVDMDIHFNDFSDTYDSFNYGVYFSSDSYYTTSFPGTFNLMVNNNNFNDLISYGVRFNAINNWLDTDIVVVDNDFSGSNYGFYINGGVDYADDWYLLFARNNGDYMDNEMLYIGSTSYGTYGVSTAQLIVQNNTMSHSWEGFHIGSIGYYDTADVLVDDNVLLDMYNGYGIYVDWVYEGSSAYVSIQRNTITGGMEAAIGYGGSEDMTLLLDIINNDIDGVQTGIYLWNPVYGDDMFTVGTVNIMQNDILNIQEYGIYVDYLYWGLLDLNVQNNVIQGDPVAYYGVTFFSFNYADWGSIVDIDLTDNTMQNGFYGIYFNYQTSGAMITLNVYNTDITNTYYTYYFNDPVSSSSDVFSIKISKSTYINSQLSFFYMNDPGYGLFLVDITDCHVIDYGSLGGYGFYMAQNDNAYIKIDVHSTEFVGSSSRLGDAFAGSGRVLINFWYIDGITSGVANGWNQRIQVLWEVDVQVYIGSSYNTTAGPGIVVYANDQFGYQSFYTTTDVVGEVLDQTVAGVLITYSGTPFSGQAVHTFWATQGPFSGSAIGTFNANGTISILLPGDNDGDGLADSIDIDDDNDGVPDLYDAFPFDASESRDTDNDGTGDNADTDDDNDGVPDVYDAFPTNPSEWSDIDGDGVGDNADIDIDGDGIPNISDTSPYNNTGFQDSDGDGIADNLDRFPYNPNEWADSDGDGIGNNADPDDDNDGVLDEVDLYPYDPTRTDTMADEETTINVDLDKAPDWSTPVAIIIIGAILVLLMWLLFGRRGAAEEEEVMPAPEEEESALGTELDEILGEESEDKPSGAAEDA